MPETHDVVDARIHDLAALIDDQELTEAGPVALEEDELHTPREDLADIVAALLKAGERVGGGGDVAGADGTTQSEKRDVLIGGGEVGGAGEEGEGLVEIVRGGLVVAGDVEVNEFVILLGETHGVEGGGGFGGDALGELFETTFVTFEHRAQNILRVDADLFITVLKHRESLFEAK